MGTDEDARRAFEMARLKRTNMKRIERMIQVRT